MTPPAAASTDALRAALIRCRDAMDEIDADLFDPMLLDEIDAALAATPPSEQWETFTDDDGGVGIRSAHPATEGLDFERLVLSHYNIPRNRQETAVDHLRRVVDEYARLSSPEADDR